MTDDSDENSSYVRNIPSNRLDADMLVTDPAYGREVTEELNRVLTFRRPKEKISKDEVISESEAKKIVKEFDKTGQVSDDNIEKLWFYLGYYTRDLRLGNINKEEMGICNFWLNMAGDVLYEGYIHSFMTCYRRVIDILELSQSKNGFFRTKSGTIRKEEYVEMNDQAKKKFFGSNNARGRL